MSTTNNNGQENHAGEPKIFAIKRGEGEIEFTRRDFLKAASVVTSATLASCSAEAEAPPAPAAEEATLAPTPTKIEPTETQPPNNFTEGELADMCIAAKAHNERVDNIVYSPDGRILVSTGDGQVKIWSLPNFALLKTIEYGGYPNASFSPDGSLLVIGTVAGTIEVLSTTDWSSINTLIDGATIRDLLFFNEGQQLLSINDVGLINQWNLNDSMPVNSASTEDKNHAKMFLSPDETMVASMDYTDQTIYMWSVPDLELLWSIQTEADVIIKQAFSPDGKYFVVPSKEGWISIWSLPDGEFVKELEAHPGNLIWNLEFSTDGNLLVTSGGTETSVWSFPQLENKLVTNGDLANIINDDQQLITFSREEENEIAIWSLKDFSIDNTFSVRKEASYWVEVSPTEDTIAIAFYESGIIEIYTLPEGQLALCLMDIASSPSEVEGIEVEIEIEGKTTTYTLPCGSPIPAGAVCTCNCVAGAGTPICSCVGHSTCSCVGHSSCTCVGHTTSPGSHYWYPN